MFRTAMVRLWWIGAVVLVASFAGALHPVGDSLAVFRLQMAFGLGALALLLAGLRAWRTAAFGLAAVVVAAATTFVPLGPVYTAPAGQQSYALYQKNLNFRLPDPEPLVFDVAEVSPDFVTLQEVVRQNQPVLSELDDDFPHQIVCPFQRVGGTAVLSRWPVIEGGRLCESDLGLSGLRVATPDGPLWVLSLHLYWPWPHRQPEVVERLLPVLATLDGPMVIGGDFNMVPWSHTVRSITGASRTELAGRTEGTFRLQSDYLRLPIDHVLVPEDRMVRSVTLRPTLGSDHKGVLATFLF